MTLLLDHKQCTPSSVQHGYISLSSAARCDAVPCPSFCSAVWCGAVVLLNIRQQLLVVVVVGGEFLK